MLCTIAVTMTSVFGQVFDQVSVYPNASGTDAVLALRMGAGLSGLNKSKISYRNSNNSEIFSTYFDNASGKYVIESDLKKESIVVGRETGRVGIGRNPNVSMGTILQSSI